MYHIRLVVNLKFKLVLHALSIVHTLPSLFKYII